MRITFTTKKGRFDNLFQNLTLIFLGIFLGSLILTFPISYLGDNGLWLGLLINLALCAATLYYLPGNRLLRLTSYGLLTCSALILLLILGSFGFGMSL